MFYVSIYANDVIPANSVNLNAPTHPFMRNSDVFRPNFDPIKSPLDLYLHMYVYRNREEREVRLARRRVRDRALPAAQSTTLREEALQP